MAQNKALAFIQRRDKNLRFFKRHYPDIYSHYINFKLTRAEVVISNSEEEVDLNVDGKSLYAGQGRARAHQGVELFKKTFSEGKLLPSQPPPWPGVYRHPRYAHSAVDRIAQLSPLKKTEFKGYPIPNFYPLIVFQGVGLGFQIEELVTSADVENAIILEPDLEIFGASLFTVDWERVCKKFQRPGRSLRFIIGVEHTEAVLWPSLMRHLMYITPIFPIMNLFLNERGDPVMDTVAKRLNREAMASLTTWGHYDDEIRQLNNALHAFHEGIRVIPPKCTVNSNIPTLIIGSGPSLDERIPDIKSVRDEVIIVSAGTGLSALLKYDIYPDFHVELESDYLNHRVLNSYDHKKLKSIKIIGASQICPLIWGLFGDQRLYFKKENPIGSLFGTPKTNISSGAPTCVNAAVALCSQLGLRNIFLFGTDFGFTQHNKHHSRTSVYMKSEDKSVEDDLKNNVNKNFKENLTFRISGVNNKAVHTTPTYFTAKRATEDLIKVTKAAHSDSIFFNCADGAEIEGASWIDSDTFLIKASCDMDSIEKNKVLRKVFSKDAECVSLDDMEYQLTATKDKLFSLSEKINGLLKTRRLKGKKDITRFSSELSRYMELTLQKEDPGFYFMIRGTVRHFLYAGFSHAFAISDPKQTELFLDNWKREFTTCMEHLPAHFASVTGKNYILDEDPWIRQSIDDPE